CSFSFSHVCHRLRIHQLSHFNCNPLIMYNKVESKGLFVERVIIVSKRCKIALEIEKLLDDTGWPLLPALQQNARLSYSELGQRVGLSSPAVAERIHRMEDAGIICGYH